MHNDPFDHHLATLADAHFARSVPVQSTAAQLLGVVPLVAGARVARAVLSPTLGTVSVRVLNGVISEPTAKKKPMMKPREKVGWSIAGICFGVVCALVLLNK